MPRAAVALVLITLFILYGSFFPFQFHAVPAGSGALAHLLGTWRSWDRRGDLVANILFYIPFGLFLAALLPRGQVQPLAALAGGGILSFAVELGQFHLTGRDSTMGDVYANAIGALLGGLVAMAAPSRLGRRVAPVPALLIAMWLAYRLYPFLPVIDLHKYLAALRAAQHAPSPYDLARYAIDWLVVAWLAGAAVGATRFGLLLLLGIAWGGQIIILYRTLAPADLAGGAIAMLGALVLRGRLPSRPLAVALALVIAAARLEPFTPIATPRHFTWSPFASLILGSPGIAVQAFCEKLFRYGSLILLAAHAGAGLRRATLGTAGLLLALSVAQLWLPSRSAEITDTLMALLIGASFSVLSGRGKE